MARMPRGITGPVHGKIGSIVACEGKKRAYVRAVNKPKKDKPSEAQLAQRARLAVVSSFLTPLRDFLTQSFANDFLLKAPFDMALSYNMKNAVCGEYPNFYIDYSRVWLSYGHLPAVIAPAVKSAGQGRLLFSWTDNSGQGKARPGDKTILVAYDTAKGLGYWKFGGAERSRCADELEITYVPGKKVVVWLGFVSKDGKDISPGVYVGEVTLG